MLCGGADLRNGRRASSDDAGDAGDAGSGPNALSKARRGDADVRPGPERAVAVTRSAVAVMLPVSSPLIPMSTPIGDLPAPGALIV